MATYEKSSRKYGVHGITPAYMVWMGLLAFCTLLGGLFYLGVINFGYDESGLSRDVSWGFHVAQFTYLVGVAASSAVLLLPAYFHGYKRFRQLLLLGELLTITVVIMSLLFIIVDLGQPRRLLNLILYPSPRSPMFWDMVTLFGYLTLCIIVTRSTLHTRSFELHAPRWLKMVILVSIIWGCAIHTVSAFLYAGLPGRHFWMTAILAARFLASAFCSGPAIMLLLALFLKYRMGFEPGKQAMRSLTVIIAYAMGCNIFFFLLEMFTALYSGIPAYAHPIDYLLNPPEGLWQGHLMRAGMVMGVLSFCLLAVPATRDNPKVLPFSLSLLVAATWIDKGPVLMMAGFLPNAFGEVTLYAPTIPELGISLGVYAFGALLLSALILFLGRHFRGTKMNMHL